MKSHFEYFDIVQRPKARGKKTHVYDIIKCDEAETRLGTIKWHGAWRQYCIFFEGETIFNIDCLDDIGGFLQDLREEHKERKKKKRCIFGMGKGKDQRCAYSLSNYHGQKTDGDPKKNPCKKCEYFRDEPYRPMDELFKSLKRNLRSVSRTTSSTAKAIGRIDQPESVPQIRPDNIED
jgi:hypothetical protein